MHLYQSFWQLSSTEFLVAIGMPVAESVGPIPSNFTGRFSTRYSLVPVASLTAISSESLPALEWVVDAMDFLLCPTFAVSAEPTLWRLIRKVSRKVLAGRSGDNLELAVGGNLADGPASDANAVVGDLSAIT
jgi:hypothetical protein